MSEKRKVPTTAVPQYVRLVIVSSKELLTCVRSVQDLGSFGRSVYRDTPQVDSQYHFSVSSSPVYTDYTLTKPEKQGSTDLSRSVHCKSKPRFCCM